MIALYLTSFVYFLLCILSVAQNPDEDFYGKNVSELRNYYDFIIIGAGSAGSVIADRLTENKNWTILLLEAGKNENFFTDVPLMAAFQSATDFSWSFRSEKSNNYCLGLKNKRCHIFRGKVLGGTSAINFLLYTRGNRLDFDQWKSYGNPGWGYHDVLPYFIKSENCSIDVKIDPDFRGTAGNLHVTHPPYHTPVFDKFMEAASEFGYKKTDPNGKFHLGFSKVQATMINGRRQSVAKAFIKPILKRPNLHVLLESRATRIIVDPFTKRAFGVEFIKDGHIHRIYTSKEVILSAGSINSPHLLMLSGIGPKAELQRYNISVLQNLNVGYNLQDHLSMTQTFLVNESVTVSDLSIQNPAVFIDYLVNGKGPLTIPGGAEAVAFIKTKLSTNISDDYPDMELVQGAAGLNNDLIGSFRHLLGIPNKLFYEIYSPVLFDPAFSITSVLLRPKSRGRVVLQNADPLKPPILQMNYLENEFDLKVLLEGLKMGKLIGESRSFQRYNSTMFKFTIPRCKHLSIGTDPHLTCLVRNLASTLGHQVGTCKMGPAHDRDAVVDAELKVHGVKGLRVVDGSIMPNIIAGHTNSVIIMIGEKASDMIKRAWENGRTFTNNQAN